MKRHEKSSKKNLKLIIIHNQTNQHLVEMINQKSKCIDHLGHYLAGYGFLGSIKSANH